MKIRDVIAAQQAAQADKSAKAAAAQQADQAFADATATAAQADAEAAKDVQKLGMVVDPATLQVYESPDGVTLHITQGVSFDADVPADPTVPPATDPNANPPVAAQ